MSATNPRSLELAKTKEVLLSKPAGDSNDGRTIVQKGPWNNNWHGKGLEVSSLVDAHPTGNLSTILSNVLLE
jgi:hypothetical protein